MQIRIALPKGRLLPNTARLVNESGWELSDYSEGARLYHLTSARFPNVAAKIFQEKDIPIQVAMGNYDLGFCGLDWIQELIVKYPDSQLIKIKDLGFGDISLFLAASRSSGYSSLADLSKADKVISIASEYPNIAESLALNSRIKRFNIFPVWGAVEIYPPENTDLVLLSGKTGKEFNVGNLIPVADVLDSRAFLIANKKSWQNKDLSEILGSLKDIDFSAEPKTVIQISDSSVKVQEDNILTADSVRLALPDGHAQKHVVNIFNKSNLNIEDYPSATGSRRPKIGIPGITCKVIRPQDMPLQVANQKFDIAITGKDWVREHLYQFPSSPIVEVLDLKYSWVRIVSAIHNDVPADDVPSYRKLMSELDRPIRIASEYTGIADKFARDHHMGAYRIVPTWGATEAFIPDDADMLIENTETGGTLKRHNLKIIETLFESTACLIVNRESLASAKASKIEAFADILRKALEEK